MNCCCVWWMLCHHRQQLTQGQRSCLKILTELADDLHRFPGLFHMETSQQMMQHDSAGGAEQWAGAVP